MTFGTSFWQRPLALIARVIPYNGRVESRGNILGQLREGLNAHGGAMKRALIGAAVMLVIAALLEVFLFNMNYFRTMGYEEVSLNDELGLVEDQQGFYRLTEFHHDLEFHDLNICRILFQK